MLYKPSAASFPSSILQLILFMALAATACCSSGLKTVPKRSIFSEDYTSWSPAGGVSGSPWSGRYSEGLGPTPSEVTNAIIEAHKARSNVVIAQQQLNAAKENVLNQQRIAIEKQTQAIIINQKSQAAAAIQRSEAIQQRIAASKAEVAHAAAHAAVEEIQKTKHEAAKLGYLTQNVHHSAGQLIYSLTPSNKHLSVSNLKNIGIGPWLDGNGNTP
ncbi:uncharacterized protein LOC108102238 [Drosophila ficusphila]|uniref:uncharacterized protein LOC108102238 n=1 Tax=Drosophila ficusphila TaxID=30025 RepID=UPI0007E6C8D3|nr:uncharacterized protein LOC108102238 [Drosophila ficusphila]